MEQLERELGLIPEGDPSSTVTSNTDMTPMVVVNHQVPNGAPQPLGVPTNTVHFLPTQSQPQPPSLMAQQNLQQNFQHNLQQPPQSLPQKQYPVQQVQATYSQPLSMPLSAAPPISTSSNPPPLGTPQSWSGKQNYVVHPTGTNQPVSMQTPTTAPVKASPKVPSTITSLPPPLPMPNFNRTGQPAPPVATPKAASSPASVQNTTSKKAPPAQPAAVKVEEKDELVVAAAAVDRQLALQPNYVTSFISEDDAWQRLIAYHVFNTPDIKTLVPPLDAKTKLEETKRAEMMVKRAEALRMGFSTRLRKEAENSQKAETLLINRLCFYDEKLEFDNLKKASTPLVAAVSPATSVKATPPRPGTLPQSPSSNTVRPVNTNPQGVGMVKAPPGKGIPPTNLMPSSPVVLPLSSGMKQPPANVVMSTPDNAAPRLIAPPAHINVSSTQPNTQTQPQSSPG